MAQAREIALYPDRWSQYFRTIDGNPFSLEERPYLIPIYREIDSRQQNSQTKMILLKCSQIGRRWRKLRPSAISCSTPS